MLYCTKWTRRPETGTLQRAGRPELLMLNGLAAVVLVAQLLFAAGHLHELRAWHMEALAVAASASQGAPASPADEHGHAACPLCWIQAAAANLLLPDPPALPRRHADTAARLAPAASRHSAACRTASFRPRAPPTLAAPFMT
jgi:hypothetical protein